MNARITHLVLSITALLPCATAQVGATWSSTSSGELNGIAFSVSGLEGALLTTSSLTGPNFAAGPLTNVSTPSYEARSNWTASFAEPVIYLRVYFEGWRGVVSQAPGGTATYDFDQPFRIVTGLSGVTVNGNQIIAPSTGFHDGIIEFTDLVSSVSCVTNAQTASLQGMTFGSTGTVCQPDLGGQGPGTATALLCGPGLGEGQINAYEVIGGEPNAAGAMMISAAGMANLTMFSASSNPGSLISGTGLIASLPLMTGSNGVVPVFFPGSATRVDLVVQTILVDSRVPEHNLAFTNAVLARFGR